MPELAIYSTPGPQGAPLPHAHDGTMWRALGCIPPTFLKAMARFADNFPTIPRSQWTPISFSKFAVPILDQGQHGSCVWHATATAHWKSWIKTGATPHEFSPTFGYAIGNGGRDAGMVIGDAADILSQYGNCLATEFPEGHIWKRDIPASAYDTAKRFRVTKTFRLESFDEVASAILLGFMPVFDVYVGNSFNNLSSDGVPGCRAGISGNHAQTADGLVQITKGQWALEGINSWGTQWGMSGRCRYTEPFLDHQIDAYAIQAVGDDPSETNLPPKAA